MKKNRKELSRMNRSLLRERVKKDLLDRNNNIAKSRKTLKHYDILREAIHV